MAKKILVAEDEKPMARALELKLNNSGFETTVVHDGDQAIKALLKEKYDLLLLDLIMPVKDGFVVLEEIKKEKISVPVIVSTNLSQDEDAKKAKDLGAVDYFVKSDTSISKVVEYIKRVVGV
ncbi:MAG: hypothetical protein A2725_04205 [Candidatus Magasanikbacteria bacterium RIFCSPHIGHO2_01_FULL_33_34]|uniref:Response regulatory domain-containing protein n=1 Tax=Candidatus Magasanikbacteria bacterium RIFCSPHIGHO2_01_FULL_33_34 TaxID=1798671 RepID=A0A1F6LHV3_9BACT|nr:MAG: hypothetical protein A2725_04205 [Candidatus Magasanikbacteria bacterium RIFCSPHIGHO2_01_FULL_33_34]OGH65168.1 MAG: hypothetical protein A3B83_03965 [Candidatus Magasanikbacteria bacterium RIFCSPHIGHO2_02_FULL_33_17]OGH75287.1 MAG: hypothetical protein A3A89_04200 [Candidatus Magasanikbacteria bacterium RIFCSPLOWO2_01_FULL_33_34]OGH81042.1 MAG: hypothetical protein A3F93_00230 [Candidatus Magasanikbacteria bacterium RIFCSPLOWO2_12_FULL_34_7]